MSRETEIRVVIGAGEYSNNPTWMQTQEKDLNLLNERDWAALFSDNSIQAILAEHVWEHLTYEEGVQAAKNCYTYLKSSGYVRCAVPDGNFPNEEYQ
jgi:predicted SAM-dependent methyltransferase